MFITSSGNHLGPIKFVELVSLFPSPEPAAVYIIGRVGRVGLRFTPSESCRVRTDEWPMEKIIL